MNLLAAELRRIQRWCDLAANETRLTLIDGAPADAWHLRQALPADNGPAGECSGPAAAADGPGRSSTPLPSGVGTGPTRRTAGAVTVDPVDFAFADACRHCGVAIYSNDASDWIHEHHLHRCQVPGHAYGYEATPYYPGPCDCWACMKFGPYDVGCAW